MSPVSKFLHSCIIIGFYAFCGMIGGGIIATVEAFLAILVFHQREVDNPVAIAIPLLFWLLFTVICSFMVISDDFRAMQEEADRKRLNQQIGLGITQTGVAIDSIIASHISSADQMRRRLDEQFRRE